MEIHRCFEYLLEKTMALPTLSEAQKDLIQVDLKYFLKQSLTDPERRNPREMIQKRWREFEVKVSRTSLLLEPRGFFHAIHEFIGHPQGFFEAQKEIAIYNQWQAHDLFEDLLQEFESKKSFFSKEEEILVFCGLKFLSHESKQAHGRQDRQNILRVYRELKPILEKYGFFYKYQGASHLSSRLKLFLTGVI